MRFPDERGERVLVLLSSKKHLFRKYCNHFSRDKRLVPSPRFFFQSLVLFMFADKLCVGFFKHLCIKMQSAKSKCLEQKGGSQLYFLAYLASQAVVLMRDLYHLVVNHFLNKKRTFIVESINIECRILAL